MLSTSRRSLGLVLLVALAAVGVVYRETFAPLVQKWIDDAAFSHGWLILPISLWLGWQKRSDLATVEWRPSWLGVVALLGVGAVWVVAKGTGILVIEQFAAVAMIPAIVMAIIGPRAAWVLAFPLAFLFFAVPFGRGLVPWFMQVTADVATWALSASGVPILRSHMFISIPSGNFEVARACSGLNYVLTGLVLGVLYAHLMYRKWTKRALCVLAFLVVPILANGLRVYFTIGVSHLTDMRWGPGVEHVTFGRIFFVAVMLLMFWIGRRWRDEHLPAPPAPPAAAPRPMTRGAWAPVPLALIAAVVGPPYLKSSVAAASARFTAAGSFVALPVAAPGWEGPLAGLVGWRPMYVGPLAESAGVYREVGSPPVSVYAGAYGLGATAGAEMISYNNRIVPQEYTSLAVEVRRSVSLPDDSTFDVREQVVGVAGGEHLVWYWFMVGDRHATSEFAVKGLEALAFVTRDIQPEKVVTLSTPLDAGAGARLQAFVAAHAACMASGLDARACRQ